VWSPVTRSSPRDRCSTVCKPGGEWRRRPVGHTGRGLTGGVYQFDITVEGNTYDCTFQVAPPLALTEDNGSSTFYYEHGTGFTNKV
jgi:hypothetical protein